MMDALLTFGLLLCVALVIGGFIALMEWLG